MSERVFHAILNERIPKSLFAGLKEEALESGEDFAEVVRDCLYWGLTQRQKAARKKAKRETPLQRLCRKNDRVGRLNFLSSHLKWLPNPCLSGGTSCQKSSC